MFKKAVYLLVVILLLFVFWWSIRASVGYAKKKAYYEIDREERQTEILQLKKELKIHEDNACFWHDEAAEFGKEVEKLKGDLIREEEEHKVELERIDKLKPTKVVLETQRILEISDSDVWLNELGVQFSLVGARTNLKVLGKYEFALDTKIPSLESTIQKQEKAIKGLNSSNFELFEALEKVKNMNLKHEKQDIEDAQILRDCEKRLGGLPVKEVIIVGAVAVLVGGLILLLL